MRMIDNALAGEQKGLKGRAYVDEDGRQGAYAKGNEWLARTADVFASLGYDLSHDTRGATFQASDRFDAPVLYAGWYANQSNGPFTLPKEPSPPTCIASRPAHSAQPTRVGSAPWWKKASVPPLATWQSLTWA